MPTEHGLISDLKYYSKKKRLVRYLRGEIKRAYYHYKKVTNFFFGDYFLYRFDPYRVLAKRFEFSLRRLNENHFKVGNYMLDSRVKYDAPPIIYSLGILTDISFDKSVIDYYKTDIFMFDPAPLAIEFMGLQTDKRFKFYPIGVWTKDCWVEFMYAKDRGRSPSMFIQHDGGTFEAECKSLQTIMTELQHQHIDILKMDIEGAALPILEHMISEKLPLPSQIVVEFENINPTFQQFCDFYNRVIRLINVLEKQNYEVFNLPRDYSFYRSVELLIVRVS